MTNIIDRPEKNLLQLPPLSLYIHIPWCVRKCPYCDFNSHESSAIPEAEYVQALIADLDQELIHVQGRQLQSIFFGGGTPSLFSEKAIAAILSAVEQRIPFDNDIEITLEANPGTTEQSKFSGYLAAGVNRLSIGVQSFQPKHLKALGRIHDKQEAITAINSARHAGFDNFNLDLMHGLPDQTLTEAISDLQQAIDLEPTHISWYQLTIEPNTAFYSAPPTLPNDDRLADIQEAGESLLATNHYLQYEVSAYGQVKKPARHNLNYWMFGDYIGIGAGAHSKLTTMTNNAINRKWKSRSPKDYLSPDKAFCSGEKPLLKDELPLEFMMNALRLTNGFSTTIFSERTGLELKVIRKTIENLYSKKLLSQNNNRIKTTDLGRRFLNEILAEF